jgi:hypothetical protein
VLALLCQAGMASDAVTFIGAGTMAGNILDQSGLSGMLEDGVMSQNLAGGLGSAIAFSGRSDLYRHD